MWTKTSLILILSFSSEDSSLIIIMLLVIPLISRTSAKKSLKFPSMTSRSPRTLSLLASRSVNFVTTMKLVTVKQKLVKSSLLSIWKRSGKIARKTMRHPAVALIAVLHQLFAINMAAMRLVRSPTLTHSGIRLGTARTATSTSDSRRPQTLKSATLRIKKRAMALRWSQSEHSCSVWLPLCFLCPIPSWPECGQITNKLSNNFLISNKNH